MNGGTYRDAPQSQAAPGADSAGRGKLAAGDDVAELNVLNLFGLWTPSEPFEHDRGCEPIQKGEDRMASTELNTHRQNLQHAPAGDAHHKCNVGTTERMVSAGAGAGLALTGLKRGGLGGMLLALAGGALLYRGSTGFCRLYQMLGYDTSSTKPTTAVPARQGRKVEKSVTIQRAPEELYQFWSNIENLPQVFQHLVSVETLSGDRSRWRAKGPLDSTLEWEAVVIGERPNEMISWRSLEGSQVDTAGSVHFHRLPGEGGTEVRVSMKYNPPGGKVGAGIADFLGQGLEGELEEDLHRFKQIMEAGNVPHA